MYIVKASDIGGLDERDAMWNVIKVLVDDYSKVHPQEISDIIRDNKIMSQVQQIDKSARLAFRCPPGLIRVIERRFPNLFTDKNNVHEFMRRFPGFRVTTI